MYSNCTLGVFLKSYNWHIQKPPFWPYLGQGAPEKLQLANTEKQTFWPKLDLKQ